MSMGPCDFMDEVLRLMEANGITYPQPEDEGDWADEDYEAVANALAKRLSAGRAALAICAAAAGSDVPAERRAAYIEAAHAGYALCSNDHIEIDDDARIAEGGEGAWVAAWVFVRDEELPEEVRRNASHDDEFPEPGDIRETGR